MCWRKLSVFILRNGSRAHWSRSRLDFYLTNPPPGTAHKAVHPSSSFEACLGKGLSGRRIMRLGADGSQRSLSSATGGSGPDQPIGRSYTCLPQRYDEHRDRQYPASHCISRSPAVKLTSRFQDTIPPHGFTHKPSTYGQSIRSQKMAIHTWFLRRRNRPRSPGMPTC